MLARIDALTRYGFSNRVSCMVLAVRLLAVASHISNYPGRNSLEILASFRDTPSMLLDIYDWETHDSAGVAKSSVSVNSSSSSSMISDSSYMAWPLGFSNVSIRSKILRKNAQESQKVKLIG